MLDVLSNLYEAVRLKCACTVRAEGLSVADDTSLRLGCVFLYITCRSIKSSCIHVSCWEFVFPAYKLVSESTWFNNIGVLLLSLAMGN